MKSVLHGKAVWLPNFDVFRSIDWKALEQELVALGIELELKKRPSLNREER